MDQCESGKVILTNMCMVYDRHGCFLVQDRLKKDWPGINFPGGHVKVGESLGESCVREMKEETGLLVGNLEQCGVYEWNLPSEGIRHLAILYRTSDFRGRISSSPEGKIFWLSEGDLSRYPLSTDFREVLKVMKKGLW
jgi:8-oxo-dGTP diphosphatase